MSDTPRTDSAEHRFLSKWFGITSATNFARELERENIRLRSALENIAGFPSVLWNDNTASMFQQVAEKALK